MRPQGSKLINGDSPNPNTWTSQQVPLFDLVTKAVDEGLMHPNELTRYSIFDEKTGSIASNINDVGKQAVVEARLAAIRQNPAAAKADVRRQNERIAATNAYREKILEPFVAKDNRYSLATETINGEVYNRMSFKQRGQESWSVNLGVIPGGSEGLGQLTINNAAAMPFYPIFGDKTQKPTSQSVQERNVQYWFGSGENPSNRISAAAMSDDDSKLIWNNPKMLGAGGPGKMGKLEETWRLPDNIRFDNSEHRRGQGIKRITAIGGTDQKTREFEAQELYPNDFKAQQIALSLKGKEDAALGHEEDIFAGFAYQRGTGVHVTGIDAYNSVPGTTRDADGNIIKANEDAAKGMKRLGLSGNFDYNYGPTRAGSSAKDSSWQESVIHTFDNKPTSGYAMQELIMLSSGGILGGGHGLINSNTQGQNQIWEEKEWSFDLPEGGLTAEQEAYLRDNQGKILNRDAFLEINGQQHNFTDNWDAAQIKDWEPRDGKLFISGERFGAKMSAKYGTKTFLSQADFSEQGFADPSINSLDMIHEMSGDPSMVADLILGGFDSSGMQNLIQEHMTNMGMSDVGNEALSTLSGGGTLRRDKRMSTFLNEAFTETLLPKLFEHQEITRTWDTDTFNEQVVGNAHVIQSSVLGSGQTQATVRVGALRVGGNVTLNNQEVPVRKLENFRPELSGKRAALNDMLRRNQLEYGKLNAMGAVTNIGIAEGAPNRSLLRSAMASKGLAEPEFTTSFDSMTQEQAQDLLDQIDAGYAAGGIDPATAGEFEKQSTILNALRNEPGFSFGMAGGQRGYLPSPATAQQFGVQSDTGESQGYMKSYTDLVAGQLSQIAMGAGGEVDAKTAQAMMRKQEQLASGNNFVKHALGGAKTEAVKYAHYIGANELEPNEQIVHPDDLASMMFAGRKAQGWEGTMDDIRAEIAEAESSGDESVTTVSGARSPSLGKELGTMYFKAMTPTMARRNRGWRGSLKRGLVAANDLAIAAWGGDKDADAASLFEASTVGFYGIVNASATSNAEVIRRARENPAGELEEQKKSAYGTKYGAGVEGVQAAFRNMLGAKFSREEMGGGATHTKQESGRQMGEHYNRNAGFMAAKSAQNMSDEAASVMDRFIGGQYQAALDMKAGDLSEGAQILRDTAKANLTSGYRSDGTAIPGIKGPQTIEEAIRNKESGKKGDKNNPADILKAFSNRLVTGVMAADELSPQEAALALAPSNYGNIAGLATQIQSERDSYSTLTGDERNAARDASVRRVEKTILDSQGFKEGQTRSILNTDSPIALMMAPSALGEVTPNERHPEGKRFNVPVFDETLENLAQKGAVIQSAINVFGNNDVNLGQMALSAQMLRANQSQNQSPMSAVSDSLLASLGVSSDPMTGREYAEKMAIAKNPPQRVPEAAPAKPREMPKAPITRPQTVFSPSSVSNPLRAMGSAIVGRGLINTDSDATELGNEIHEQFANPDNWNDAIKQRVGGSPVDINALNNEKLQEDSKLGTWLETKHDGVGYGGFADKVVYNPDTNITSVVDFKTTSKLVDGGLGGDALEDAFMQAKLYQDALSEANLPTQDIRIQAVDSRKYQAAIKAGKSPQEAMEASLGKSHSWTEHYGEAPVPGQMPASMQKRFAGYKELKQIMSKSTGAKGGISIQARGKPDADGNYPAATEASTLAGVSHMDRELKKIAPNLTPSAEEFLGITKEELAQGVANPKVQDELYGFTLREKGTRAEQAAMLKGAIEEVANPEVYDDASTVRDAYDKSGGGSIGGEGGSVAGGPMGNAAIEYNDRGMTQMRTLAAEQAAANRPKRVLTQDHRKEVANTIAQLKEGNWKGQWQYLQGKAANGEQMGYHEAQEFQKMQEKILSANSIVTGAVGATKPDSYTENNDAAQQIADDFGASWGSAVGGIVDEITSKGAAGDPYRKTRDNAAIALAKGKPLDAEFSTTKSDQMMGQAQMLGKMFENLDNVMKQVTTTGGKLTEQQAKQVETNLKAAENLEAYMDKVNEAAAAGSPQAQEIKDRFDRISIKGHKAEDVLGAIRGQFTGEGTLGDAVGQIRAGFQNTIAEDTKDPLWKRYMSATMSKGETRENKLSALFGSDEWQAASGREKLGAMVPGAVAGLANHALRDSWMYARTASEFFDPTIKGAAEYRQSQRGYMGGLVSSNITAQEVATSSDYMKMAGMDARLENKNYAFGRTSQETWGGGIEALGSIKNSSAFALGMPIIGAGLMGQLAGQALPAGMAIGGRALAPMLPGALMATAGVVAATSSLIDYSNNTTREFNLINKTQSEGAVKAFFSDPMGALSEAHQAVFDNDKWQQRMGRIATSKAATDQVMNFTPGMKLGAGDTMIYGERLWDEKFKGMESVGLTKEMFQQMYGATNQTFGTEDPLRQQQTLEAMSASIITGSVSVQDYQKAQRSIASANSGIGIQANNSAAMQKAMFDAAQMEKWRPGSMGVATQLGEQFLGASNAQSALLGREKYDTVTETGKYMDANDATKIAMQEEYRQKNTLRNYGVDAKRALQFSREQAVGLDPMSIAANRAEQAGISTDDVGFSKILDRTIQEFGLGDNASTAEIFDKRKKAREEGMATQMGNIAQRFGQTALATKGLTEEQFGYTQDLAQSTGFYSQQYGFDTSKLQTTQIAQGLINQPNGTGYAQAQVYQQMGAMGLQQAASYSAYGNNNAKSVQFMQQLAMQSGGDMNKFNQGMAVIQGDQIANSQFARQNGLLFNADRYLVQTGEGGSTKGMSRNYDEKIEVGMQLRLAQTANKFGIGLSPQQLSMNQVDVERAQRKEDLEFRDYGFEMANRGMERQISSTFGRGLSKLRGRLGQDAKSLGLSSAETSRYASALVEGQGEWELEDRGVAQSRRQEDFSFGQEGQRLALSQSRFQASGQQYQENLALRQQQQQVQWGYQAQDMQRESGRAMTQLNWQGEDMAYSRNMNQMQFGWQMQDFDRNIKYARGRERQDMLRQQERAVITQAAEMGKMDREEGRLETKKGWQGEDVAREKERFEQSKKMTQEQMALEARHYAQNRAFETQEMAMSAQAHARQRQFMAEQRQLEDQGRNLRRAIQIQEVADNRAQQQRQQQHAKTVQQLTDVLTVHQKSLQEDSAALSYMAKTGELLDKSLALVNPKLATFQQTMNGVATGIAQATQTALQAMARLGVQRQAGITQQDQAKAGGGRGFRTGGYTGSTPGVKGEVHEEEVVVTREGALLKQGDSPHAKRTADATEKLVELMSRQSRGNVNLTIQTNDVKTATSAAMSLADQVYSKP